MTASAAPLKKRDYPSSLEHEEELLSRAIRAFSRQGYAGTTTRDLAAACGVSEPTLYRSYGSKEGVFVAALQAICRRRIARYRQEADGAGTWLERTDRLARLDKAMDAEHPEELQVLQNAMADLANPAIRAVVGQYYRNYFELNLRLIREAQSRGELSGDIAERELRWLIWLDMGAGMLSGMLDLMQLGDLKDPGHYPWMLRHIYTPFAKDA